MFKIGALLIFLFVHTLLGEDCVQCHTIEHFDTKHHDFSCSACHLRPEKRDAYDHKTDIVLHPDSLENASLFCGACHAKEIEGVLHSSHVTLKNAINQTRHLWGAKGNFTLQTLPHASSSIKEPKDLVDDFLRRKCLKCHIGSQGSGEEGMYRGKGCMACHMEYAKDGSYHGSDLTVQGKQPYAKIHTMSQKPPMSACLSCHNKNFIGTDYLGLFPKDFEQSYRAPITAEGKYPPRMYGTDYHHLTEDIHYQKGLTCVDCHTKSDVMGGMHSKKDDLKKVTCQTCHTTIKNNEAHARYHQNVSCSACHASWQMSNYELSVFRDDRKDYDKWKHLIKQEDAYLETFLTKAIAAKEKPEPMMPDWIDGTLEKGIWYSGWRFRRWETVLLGNDEHGKVKLLRPLYQYRISYRDENATMILNDVATLNDGEPIESFEPYSPHTITTKAKSCESCHENPLLLNQTPKSNTVLDLLNGTMRHGSPLSLEQVNKLHSDTYKKVRASMFFKP